MANPLQLKTYTPRERNMYMTGLFGQNILFNIMTVFTSYYMQSVLLIPMGLVGTVLVIAQIWDAINDPIMGTIVDRTRSRWGKCRPYLLFAPVVTGVVTMLCFLSPTFNPGLSTTAMKNVLVVAWACGAFVIWDLVYTTGDIPLWGISALMTEDEKQRQKLQAAARIAAGIGAGVAVLAFQPVALAVSEKLEVALNKTPADAEKLGFILTALGFTIVGVITFQLTGIFVREKIKPSVKENKIFENFGMMWRNKPFRQLLLSGVLSAPRGLTMLLALTLVTFYFSNKDPGKAMLYIALIGGGLFLGMFGASAMVPKLLDRFTKKNLYNASNLLEIAPNLFVFVLYLISTKVSGGLTTPALLIPAILMFTLKGVCMGIFNTLQTAMIADAVDYEDYTSHVRPDAVFFSGQTFMVKIGTGISNIIYAVLCGFVGFSDKNIEILNALIADESVKQVPREVMEKGNTEPFYEMIKNGEVYGSLNPDQVYGFFTMMFFCVSILPAVANLLAVIPTWKYALTPEKYKEVLAELQRRRREADELAIEAE